MSTPFMDIPRAPKDITPEKFFKEWLPQQAEQMKELLDAFSDFSASLSVKVEGEGGGEWTAGISGGKLEVKEGLSPDSVVTFILSTKNFIQAVTGELDDLRLQPQIPEGELTPEKIKEQLKNAIDTVKNIQGSIEFHAEEEGNPFVARVKFAGELKPAPDCTIKMDKEVLREMAKGETNPQAAFMAGKVRIEGDMGILMQLMPLLTM